jgi:hypothetical protein
MAKPFGQPNLAFNFQNSKGSLEAGLTRVFKAPRMHKLFQGNKP